MIDQKAENLLNLALDATAQEREKSLNLNTAYDSDNRTWEVIVKYNGDISVLESEHTKIVPLLNRYAIVTTTREDLERLLRSPQVEYMEQPKRLFFEANTGRSVSCINPVQNPPSNLRGRGVLVALIDSGVDIMHMDFRNEDGTTRIAALWDQTKTDRDNPPPKGYTRGAFYDRAAINALIKNPQQEIGAGLPGVDLSGHGTSVLGIAAGNGRQSNGIYRGVAPESTIIAVKLGVPMPEGFPRTTEMMQAVNFVIETAMAMAMPVVINLSFGNTYGSHNGTSLLETYLSDMAGVWKNSIVVGSGNEGNAAGHTSGTMRTGYPEEIPLAVSSYEAVLNVQIWKNYFDNADIEIIAPGGSHAGPFQQILGPQRFTLEGTELLLFYGKPNPYSTLQEIYMDFLPRKNYVTDGLWYIRLIPRRIVEGTYHLWLPGHGAINSQTRFLYPTPNTTLTIPSTAARVITVGAYDGTTDAYADFSGRGLNGFNLGLKPDIVAPGVDVETTKAGGGYHAVTGTSFAAPFVTGSCALLMEYGIVRQNDPFLYGDKIKAYLMNGARQLPGFDVFPNPQVGFGALCLRDSFPE